jgi:hypothetical protein
VGGPPFTPCTSATFSIALPPDVDPPWAAAVQAVAVDAAGNASPAAVCRVEVTDPTRGLSAAAAAVVGGGLAVLAGVTGVVWLRRRRARRAAVVG